MSDFVMLKWLLKFFQRKTTMVKKFDILVHDQDSNVPPKKESGVMAESPRALESMYGMCGQSIEILRTYSDDECENYGKFDIKNAISNHEKPICTGKLGNGTGLLKIDSKELENFTKSIGGANQSNEKTSDTVISPTISNQDLLNKKPPSPPKFFQVGGIKCKMENGRFYQKQWMRLTDNEADEIRIVSDKNNKICPLTNKHIEILKWVLVEDEEKNETVVGNDDSNCNLELING